MANTKFDVRANTGESSGSTSASGGSIGRLATSPADFLSNSSIPSMYNFQPLAPSLPTSAFGLSGTEGNYTRGIFGPGGQFGGGSPNSTSQGTDSGNTSNQESSQDGKEQNPDDRTSQTRKRAKKDKDKKLVQPAPADPRVKGATKDHPDKHLGIGDMSKEGQGGNNDGNNFLLDDIAPLLSGVMQMMGTQIPGMQQLLSQIPNELLGQFLGALPPQFQALLPPGVIPGLNTGMVNLNGLLQMAGGAAFGSAANQIIRSLLPGVGLTGAVQQLASIPLAAQAGLSSQAPAAALASTISNVQQVAGLAAGMGIPLDPSMINQAAAIALQATGIAQQIPTNIMGSNLGAIGNVLGAAMGGMQGGIPIIPSNLSMGMNAALLSGLGQFLPPEVAQGLFTAQQLASMLPGNLQNLIPQVAPIMANGVENLMSQIANAAPQMAAGSGGAAGGGKGCQHVDPSNDGKASKDTRYIDYTQMLSQNFSLFNMTLGSGVQPGRYPLNGDKPEDIIKNLSGVAENVLEPLRKMYPGFTIVSGWRDEGEHKEGKCVDVAWSCSPAKLMEIAQWVQACVPCQEVKMNWQKVGWLHIKYDQGGCGASGSTQLPGGGQFSGFVNAIQSGLSGLA